jgi:dihydropteroate synthase
MAREGADIVDIGGQSTRPYSDEIPETEEIDRVVPVVDMLSKELAIPISIDTTRASVAREALRAGACMVNDVSALRFDPAMASVVAQAGVPVVLMHMKGKPKTMQENPVYQDLFGEILEFLGSAVKSAAQAGIREDLTIVDPGIGFGKTFQDNLRILGHLDRFGELGRPVLIGPSNKAFIGHVLGKDVRHRDIGTMAAVSAGVMGGAQIVRVHDVPKAVDTVKMIDAIVRAC